jgi:hypothetical protein
MIESRRTHIVSRSSVDFREDRTVQVRKRVPGLEAVVNAALALGSNGRGRGGVGGYMFAKASQNPERFARLLEKALEQKNRAWGGGMPC